LVFKTLLSIIIIPLILLIVNKGIVINKIEYLKVETIKDLITNPISLILLLVGLILIILYNIFDMTSLIVLYDASYHKIQIGFKETIKVTLIKLKKLLHPKNGIIYLYMTLLIALTLIGLVSLLSINYKIPLLLNNYYNFKTYELAVLLVCICILLVLMMRMIFTLHFMILDNKEIEIAINNSYKLIHGNRMVNFLKLILSQFVTAFILFFIIFIITTFISFITRLFIPDTNARTIINIVRIISAILIYIYLLFNNCFNTCIISNAFYNIKNENNYVINNYSYSYNKNDKPLVYIFISIIFILTIISSVNFINKYKTLNIHFDPYQDIEITGHRGSSILYPENTMSAFKKAYEQGAEWIELDVIQSKDLQLVISHDNSMIRTSGKGGKITNMTYDQILTYDVGWYKGSKFYGEHAPLLKDVLEYFKDKDIMINIELKPKGKEINYEESIIDEVKRYHMEDKVIIASITHSCIERVKQIDSSFKTAYVIPIAIGDYYNDEYADIFSVELTSINKDDVKKIHDMNKQIYAWTLDDEYSIQHAIDLKVDNIITDNIELAKYLNIKNDRRDYLSKYIKILLKK
jgi:glycerophosphoryl diester phosphodiesterase